MASYQTEREDFIATMQVEGMPPEIARRIMRHANTIQRLNAAECNGDYPCDNGERPVEFCSRCEAGYVRASMYRDHTTATGKCQPGDHALICPNCRAQDLIREWCGKASPRFIDKDSGNHTTAFDAIKASDMDVKRARITRFEPVFQGDPRGACVKIRVPSGKTDDYAREGVCVPTRRY